MLFLVVSCWESSGTYIVLGATDVKVDTWDPICEWCTENTTIHTICYKYASILIIVNKSF